MEDISQQMNAWSKDFGDSPVIGYRKVKVGDWGGENQSRIKEAKVLGANLQ